jgi:hypothetical protein
MNTIGMVCVAAFTASTIAAVPFTADNGDATTDELGQYA